VDVDDESHIGVNHVCTDVSIYLLVHHYAFSFMRHSIVLFCCTLHVPFIFDPLSQRKYSGFPIVKNGSGKNSPMQ
jgi:hypothetical protein